MINPDNLTRYYPDYLIENPHYKKYILKEYIQLMILDYLATTKYIKKIVLIGGTNLRLTKGIDRFSEDLDFDCKLLDNKEFLEMTDGILTFLKRSGYHVMIKDKLSEKLTAFRRNFYFPGLLFDLKLSAYRNERFLIKVEAEDQGINYTPVMAKIKECGFFFNFPVPPDPVLCAMKISALLVRSKGRDFYDVMFLMDHCEPDYSFLAKRNGIHNKNELIIAFRNLIKRVDLKHKAHDFEHLAFQERNNKKILMFGEFIDHLQSS